ncbi:MAG: hypothetical protein K6U74_14400 [Firmicutes bacterium]|nr:hypothetical protein [Bacillota bacterium]
MDVMEFVSAIRPGMVKVNCMHGKPHDLVVAFRYSARCSQLDALNIARNAASWWPFCSYAVTPAKNGCWQIEMEYRVKQGEMDKFCELFSLQTEASMV